MTPSSTIYKTLSVIPLKRQKETPQVYRHRTHNTYTNSQPNSHITNQLDLLQPVSFQHCHLQQKWFHPRQKVLNIIQKRNLSQALPQSFPCTTSVIPALCSFHYQRLYFPFLCPFLCHQYSSSPQHYQYHTKSLQVPSIQTTILYV